MTKDDLQKVREALETAQEYVEAELRDRQELYGKYPQMAYKYQTEQRDFDECKAALAIIDAALAQTEQEPDDWQQYAQEGENAQRCIERHRKEHEALIALLANARRPYSDNETLKL